MRRVAPSHASAGEGSAGLSPSVAALRRASGPALLVAMMLAAAIVWGVSVAAINPTNIGDTGLVSVLPPAAFASLALACVTFALALRAERPSTPLLLVLIALLIFMLYGATPLFQQAPAFNVVFRHAGVTDFISATGRVDPQIDAYFNWPGFFFWAALVTHVAGLHSVLAWSGWSAVAFELAYIPPLLVIARAFTPDRRVAWTAVWIFYLANWVGQDYFSPQAMAYLWYLALVAALLTYLSKRTERRPAATPRQQAAVMAICIVMVIAAVASHQLTPWMMLGGTVALVLAGRSSARGLPAVILMVLAVWLMYAASDYLGGHLKVLLGQTLDVNQSVTANVSSRLGGSPGHQFVVDMRLAMTGILWAVAAIGVLRGFRTGRRATSHLLLLLSAPVFVLLQPYGGEMLLRVYLFSLPFTACFAAQAIAAPRNWGQWRVAAVLAAVGLAFAGPFLYTRYGNEASSIFTPGEVRAAERLYTIAPHGSLLLAGSPNVAWKQEHYGDYHYQLLGNHLAPGPRPWTPPQLARKVALYMQHAKEPSFLLITRAQMRYDELLGAQWWGSVANLKKGVAASPSFVKVFDDGAAQIYRLRLKGGAS